MIKKVSIFIIVFFICLTSLVSKELESNKNQWVVTSPNLSSLLVSKNDFKNILTLDSQYGSHRKGIGFNNVAINYRNLPFSSDYLGFSGRIGYKHYESDFGIPGSTDILESHVKILYSIGNKNIFYSKYPEIFGYGRHTFSIGYNGYLTTDSTSQVVGQIDYTYANNKFAYVFNYMNDTIFVYPSDKYRTAAVKLTQYRVVNNNLIGISAGFSIWAGERIFNLEDIWNNGNINIPDEVHRGETVTLYNGKDYATNIVYASISFNNLSISFGYDSNIFRQAIHNNIHYLINDGNLPDNNRADKIYFEVKIGLPDLMF
ncbi:MAG: hypothetical protein JXR64_04705 [Spirochaetales bacterium]|nr:hypothetical protein [Spirochaetales bacterium]